MAPHGRTADLTAAPVPKVLHVHITAFTDSIDPKKKRKDKWLFTKKDEPIFCIAGIWRDTPEVGEAFTMLTMEPGPDIAPYHDRQIGSIKYTERLAEVGVEPSVGSVGDSYDNALAETINGLYKAEVIHRRGPWRSFEAVEFATLEWVDWFNNRRLLEPIGNIPPAEAEARYYAMLEEPAMAA